MANQIGNILNAPIPESLCELPPIQGQSSKVIHQMIKEDVPKNDRQNLDSALRWTFILEKTSSAKKNKTKTRKKTFLTRKDRKCLNILKLPKTDWNYGDLQAIRDLWKTYMIENLEQISKSPACTDPTWNSFSVTVGKSEFIGAEFTVVRSKMPSSIGISGTVVLETRATFQIVTANSTLKILLKEPSVFSFNLNNIKFTFFGKHLLTKPGERSVKKIKLQMIPDL